MRSPALLLALLLPLSVFAKEDLVEVETLVASPNGRYYAIIQQDGELELVRRAEGATPIRSRRGEKRPDEQSIRMGATAAEVARASGLTHGIEPERGDAIIASVQLRDRLADLHVFDDGTGFVARYDSSPSDYADLSPVRHPDGTDVGLVTVEHKPMGEKRLAGDFVHLYTRKDALFWGDPSRDLVLVVSGAHGVEVTVDGGARLAAREGREPALIAWSWDQEDTVEAPFEALLDRISSGDPEAGLASLFLARQLDLSATARALHAVVTNPAVPHPVRLHVAATQRADGDRRGDRLILGTARGQLGPGPHEARLPTDGADAALRAWAIRLLPVSHPERAFGELIRLATDPDEGVAAAARKALDEGPWSTKAVLPRAVLAAQDRSRPDAERAAATAWLAANQGPQPLLAALAADSSPAVVAAAGQAPTPVIELAAKLNAKDPAARREAAQSLARRGTPESRDALFAHLGSDAPSAAAAVLGALWRVEDPRSVATLRDWSSRGGAEGAAARHSLLLGATGSSPDDRGPWVAALEPLASARGRAGRTVRRTLGVLEPTRVRWEP